MRRFFLITPLVLIILFAVAAGAAWFLLKHEPFVKSQLHFWLLKYTGRELTVDGPAELTLGRVVRLEARGVHFQNAAWADDPDMASAGHLVVSIDLSTLFDDRIVFPEVALEDCKVLVLRNDEDELNWAIGPGGDSAPAPETESPPMEHLPVDFIDLSISNCGAFIDSLKLEYPLDIKVADLVMEQQDNGRWQSRAAGSVNDMPLSIDGWLFPLQAFVVGGRQEHDFNARLGDITLRSSGSIQDVRTGAGANISTRFNGPEIESLLREFKLPLFSEGEFDYRLKLNTEGDMTRLDLDGDLGSIIVEADGELDRLVRPTRGSVRVSVDGPNLGVLARVFGIDGVIEEAFSHFTHAEFREGAIQIHEASVQTDSDHFQVGGQFSTAAHFAGTELDIGFRSDQVGDWITVFGQPKQALGPIEIDGKLLVGDGGAVSVEARVQQDGTRADLAGSIGRLPDAIQPDLTIDFQSPDPSHLAGVVGLEMLPAAPLSIRGRVGIDDERIELDRVQVDLAGDRLDVHGVLNLSNRYAKSELDLKLDVKNAGDLGRLFGKDGLPEHPVQLAAEVRPEDKGLAFTVRDGNLGSVQLELDGRIPDLQQPMAVDGQFDVSLPRLSDLSLLLPDTRLPDAPFKAGGKLETRDERVHLENVNLDLDGHTARVNGHVSLEKRFAGSDLTFDVDIQSIGRLASLFGEEGLPDEPMKLTANIRPEGKGMAFRLVDGDLRDVQVEIEGRIADLDQPTGIDAQFDIDLPRLSEISFLFPGRDLPDLPFSAKGGLVNQQDRTQLQQVKLKMGTAEARIDGSLLPDNGFQFDIGARGPDASKLGALLGTSLPEKNWAVSTAIIGKPAAFDLKGLDVALGSSEAWGDLEIDLGEVTRIHGQLTSPKLDLSHWYPGTGAKEEPRPAEETREWMFDETPVQNWKDLGLDLGLELEINELDLGNTRVRDIEMNLALSRDLLEVSPFTLKGELGGSYNGKLSLDSRSGIPTLNIDMDGKDVRLGIAALPEQDPMTYPPFEIEAVLDGQGRTRRELASSLDGRLRVYQGSGQVAAAGLDLLFSDFLTQLITTLNPFHESSKYTNLDCAVIAADAASGAFTVAPVIFQTEQITIISEGTVDLNTENIDLSFQTKPRQGLGISAGALIHPMIKVGGRLTSPAVEMDTGGAMVSGGLAVATVGISVLAKSMSDRFLSSDDPCGDARAELEKNDAGAG